MAFWVVVVEDWFLNLAEYVRNQLSSEMRQLRPYQCKSHCEIVFVNYVTKNRVG